VSRRHTHRRCLIEILRFLPAVVLVVRRRYLIVAPRPFFAVSRSAPQVLDRGAHAAARGATRSASQELDRGAQADVRGAAIALDRAT
jgi:hypothetical protein